MLWIAKEGLKAPLPEPWKPCETAQGDIYYFNFQTGESIWEHPCDQYYKQMCLEEKMKRVRRQIEYTQAVEDSVYAEQGTVAVQLPTKVGTKVSIESEKLNKEQRRRIEEYREKKNKELEEYKKNFNMSPIQIKSSAELLDAYRNEQKALLLTREVTFSIIIERTKKSTGRTIKEK